MSGTFTGTRVYAPSVDRRESGRVVALDSPNLGVCFKARLDKMGDTRRKLSTARSSVVKSVKCAYVGRDMTNKDQPHANKSRLPVA